MVLLRVLLILVPVCANEPATAASPLEGSWFGERGEPGTGHLIQWLVHRRSDGTYTIEFHIYRDCSQPEIWLETGVWRFSKNLYFTMTLEVDGTPTDVDNPFYQDTYRVEGITPTEMRYTHLKSGRAYSVQRVEREFLFPGCAHIAEALSNMRIAPGIGRGGTPRPEMTGRGHAVAHSASLARPAGIT
ncbi:MAG: hypothetical protein OEM93_14155 [Rhodospirillales bacterium]|nr:hypothetical protein [Rhodospirillales bacterium]